MAAIQADVAIVGGGMVGISLAAALARGGLEIVVIEQKEPTPFDPVQPYDLRVSAVSPASQGFLDAIGAWLRLTEMRLCPYRRMRVWDKFGNGSILFNAADIGEPVLGYIAENRLIQRAIWDVVKQSDNIRILLGTRPVSMSVNEISAELELENGQSVTAGLIVGADGARSWVRQQARIGETSWDYDQHALVMSVRTEYPQQDITWQRFTDTGPEAFLPLPGPHGSLVWYHQPDEVARLMMLDDAVLLEELHARFPTELGRIEAIEDRGFFAIRRMHAHNYAKHRVVLVGDAAHAIHPLAGQGVNLGFMDAAALAETLLAAIETGADIGSLRVLRRYERARKGDNHAVQSAMDVFHRAFLPQHPPLRLARNLGLNLANGVTPLKRQIERLAVGRRVTLPLLSRGR